MADQPPHRSVEDLCRELEQEVRHRIGNSFQAVSALTKARARAVADAPAKAELIELATRIEAFAAAHANLCFRDGRPIMLMKETIESLVNGLRLQHEITEESVDLDVASFAMDPDQGLPLVLILHELSAHSFKCHGAPKICLAADTKGDVARLTIVDLGFDLPKEVSTEAGGSLGWHLIRLLVRQSRGTLLRPEGRNDAVEIIVPIHQT
ncbi:sensor histidine kinase [Caenispirillum salinarum]|uniref:sensor histidine kinase n=1 Tax=Caenispirillum salinarum TaxID=859058 RepID=UPI00384F13BC